jgi:hypothetical protein
MTAQEKELLINQPLEVQSTGKHIFVVEYASTAQAEFCTNGSNMVRDDGEKFTLDALKDRVIRRDFKQKSLF